MTARVVSCWCARIACSGTVAVLIALDDGYYLSCRRLDPDTHRYYEFWGSFRERGEFHVQEEADRWAIELFRRPMQDACPVDMVDCPPDFLATVKKEIAT